MHGYLRAMHVCLRSNTLCVFTNTTILCFVHFLSRGLQLIFNEVSDLLDKREDLYIELAHAVALTDEYSGAEGDGTVFLPPNLSGNLSLAPIEFRVSTHDSFDENGCSTDKLDEDTNTEHQKIKKKKTQVRLQLKHTPLFREVDYSNCRHFAVVEFFELFIDEEILP